MKFGSTKFSNYSKRDTDDLITNIETEIRNHFANEQAKAKSVT